MLFKTETAQLIFYANSLIALYGNRTLISIFLGNYFQSKFRSEFISGSVSVFRVDVLMKLCVLKCVLDG